MKNRNRAEEILQILEKTAKSEVKKMQKNGTKVSKFQIKVESKPLIGEKEKGNVTSEKNNLEKSSKRGISEKQLVNSEKNEERVSGVTVYLYPSQLKKLDEMALYLVNEGKIEEAYYTNVIRQAILKHEPGEWILKSDVIKEGSTDAKTITLYDSEIKKLNQYSAYFIKQRMIKEAKHSKIIRRMLHNLEPGEWLNN